MPSSGTGETAFTVELKRWAGNRPVSSARFDLMESDVRASNQPNVTTVARELRRSVTTFY
jgi:hypothetical protein